MAVRKKTKHEGARQVQDHILKSRSWDYDVHGSLRRSRLVAWGVATCAIGLAGVLALAIVIMLPLKTYVPYVISHDKNTGWVEVTQGVAPGDLSEDEAITRYFVARHILARETYDHIDLQTKFDYVMATSVEAARESHRALYASSNDEAPFNLHGYDATISTIIKSVSFLNEKTASVRFTTKLKDKRGGVVEENNYVAIVGFRYVNRPKTLMESVVNPLGFQVVTYRRDQETI